MDSGSVNPLLSKLKLPGKVVKLPSGGFFYTDEIDPGCNAEVDVKPMSALAEINIKSPELLFTGKAIEEVFSECIPQVRRPLDLYAKDVDALLCFLRMVTYGNTLELTARHECANGKEHTYEVDLEEITSKIRYLDPTTFKQLYSLQLSNGQEVVLKPLTMRDVIAMLQTAQTQLTGASSVDAETMKRFLIQNLLLIIKSVDGVEDRAAIEEWVRAIPSRYVQEIYGKYERANDWGISTSKTFTCPDCGQDFTMELPLNPVNFFSG